MKAVNTRNTPAWPTLAGLPVPAKVLVTMVVAMLSLGMFFAVGQLTVHDVMPTLFEKAAPRPSPVDMTRGDLFASPETPAPEPAFYKTDKFIFALKFTHIHMFGMSAIFFVMGLIILFAAIRPGLKTGLIVLPFAGILIDLAAVWLKLFLSPTFFWMHIPGGLLLFGVFIVDVWLAITQTWFAGGTKDAGSVIP